MKKILKSIFILVFSLTCISAFSQEQVNELKAIPKGIMPQQGDIALSVSLNPLLNYVGNIFNNSTDNSLDEFTGEPLTKIGKYSPTYSIMGKYMLTDKIAFRANIGFLGRNNKTRMYVQNDEAVYLDPNSKDEVIDEYNSKRNGLTLSLGAEFHKRYRRIQGYAGASLLYGRSSQKITCTYGNEITEVNPDPTRSDYISPWLPSHFSSLRLTESHNEKENAVGLVGHVGIEWFFAPKVSIGGEISLPVLYQFGGQTLSKYDGWNNAALKVEEYTEISAPGNKSWSYGTGNLGGNLFINFYF